LSLGSSEEARNGHELSCPIKHQLDTHSSGEIFFSVIEMFLPDER
jgi:hypothetical protein